MGSPGELDNAGVREPPPKKARGPLHPSSRTPGPRHSPLGSPRPRRPGEDMPQPALVRHLTAVPSARCRVSLDPSEPGASCLPPPGAPSTCSGLILDSPEVNTKPSLPRAPTPRALTHDPR